MTSSHGIPRLKLLPISEYRGVNRDDPIRYYNWPIFGGLYRRRVELCLAECRGGERILEVGFGTGVTFLSLQELYSEIHGLDLTADTAAVKAVFDRHGVDTHLQNGSVLSMSYPDGMFDTVLLISILEHLQPAEQEKAFQEIGRVLKPGGQVVYGVPVERPLMVFLFRLLGHDIRREHFSTEIQVAQAAGKTLKEIRLITMQAVPAMLGPVYQVGHFLK